MVGVQLYHLSLFSYTCLMQTPGFCISAGTPGTAGAAPVGATYVGFGTVPPGFLAFEQTSAISSSVNVDRLSNDCSP